MKKFWPKNIFHLFCWSIFLLQIPVLANGQAAWGKTFLGGEVIQKKQCPIGMNADGCKIIGINWRIKINLFKHANIREYVLALRNEKNASREFVVNKKTMDYVRLEMPVDVSEYLIIRGEIC